MSGQRPEGRYGTGTVPTTLGIGGFEFFPAFVGGGDGFFEGLEAGFDFDDFAWRLAEEGGVGEGGVELAEFGFEGDDFFGKRF